MEGSRGGECEEAEGSEEDSRLGACVLWEAGRVGGAASGDSGEMSVGVVGVAGAVCVWRAGVGLVAEVGSVSSSCGCKRGEVHFLSNFSSPALVLELLWFNKKLHVSESV